MYMVFFDLPTLIKGLAEAKVFHTEDELKAYLKEKDSSLQSIDIAAVGYCNKTVCKDEFREVWGVYTEADPKMIGKIIQVEDEHKFLKSINKWVDTFEEQHTEEAAKIRELFHLQR